jgi:hypothetical protein
MHRPEDYRRAAAETRQLAAQTTDKKERAALLRLAADWERRAQEGKKSKSGKDGE